jgi:hypothetical protein
MWSKSDQEWLISVGQLVSGKLNSDLIRLLKLFELEEHLGLYAVYMLNRLGLERQKYGINYSMEIMRSSVGSFFSKENSSET